MEHITQILYSKFLFKPHCMMCTAAGTQQPVSTNPTTLGVDVGFNPETYSVTEGNTRELQVVVSGSYDIPVEVLLSTTGISATGN